MDSHLHAIGYKVMVPSSLTGAMLEHFVPYALNDVAARWVHAPSTSTKAADSDIVNILPLLALLSAGRNNTPTLDLGLLRLHVQIASGARTCRTVDDLISLGNDISTANRGLRQQIVYSGGRTPSTATSLYAPASEVPDLIKSLAAFFAGALDGWDPMEAAVVVCEHSVRIHPFNDGNGRWSRLLALEASRRAGSLWEGTYAAVLNRSRAHSAQALGRYVDASAWSDLIAQAREGSEKLRTLTRHDSSSSVVAHVWGEAIDATKTTKTALELCLSAFADFPESAILATRYGWSNKKAADVLTKLSHARGDRCPQKYQDSALHQRVVEINEHFVRVVNGEQ